MAKSSSTHAEGNSDTVLCEATHSLLYTRQPCGSVIQYIYTHTHEKQTMQSLWLNRLPEGPSLLRYELREQNMSPILP